MEFALAWPLSLVCRWRGIPIVYVIHNDKPLLGDYFPVYQSALQRLLLRQASHVVVLSDFVRRHIATTDRIRSGTGCTLIPLGAHDVGASHGARPLREGEVRLLFLGRLLRYKGLSMLADALEPLRDLPGWRLTIAGMGPEAESVQTRFGHFPQVKVDWVRELSETDIDALLASHDVLVCPYIEASQSGVLTEALYHGMPSLVMPVGALPEQINFGEGGWVAPSASCEGLRETIRMILAEPASIRRASLAAGLMVAPPRNKVWGDLIEAVAQREPANGWAPTIVAPG
jgi:glycosyltransferase involved in cell wall biosynthesis